MSDALITGVISAVVVLIGVLASAAIRNWLEKRKEIRKGKGALDAVLVIARSFGEVLKDASDMAKHKKPKVKLVTHDIPYELIIPIELLCSEAMLCALSIRYTLQTYKDMSISQNIYIEKLFENGLVPNIKLVWPSYWRKVISMHRDLVNNIEELAGYKTGRRSRKVKSSS